MTNTTLSDKRNQSLMMDFYELTMSQVYFDNGTNEEVVLISFIEETPIMEVLRFLRFRSDYRLC